MRLAIAWRYRLQLPLEDASISPVTYWRLQWPLFECEVKYQEPQFTPGSIPTEGDGGATASTRPRRILPPRSTYRAESRIVRLYPKWPQQPGFPTIRQQRGRGRRNSEWLAGLCRLLIGMIGSLQARFPRFTPKLPSRHNRTRPLRGGDAV